MAASANASVAAPSTPRVAVAMLQPPLPAGG
jgi:hypothetical protein